MTYYSIKKDYENPCIYIHRVVYKKGTGIECIGYTANRDLDLDWKDYDCTMVATCESLRVARPLMELLSQEAETGAEANGHIVLTTDEENL